jgi:hypothetical protein
MWCERLPAELEYLAPVIERLDAIKGDLNEDNEFAGALVENVLRERVRGLTPAEADQLLVDDSDALAEWLQHPGLEDSSAHFVNGFLLGASGSGREFLGEPFVPTLPPQPTVDMEIPDGFELVDTRGGMQLKAGKVQVLIQAVDTKLIDPRALMGGGNMAAFQSAFPGMPQIDDCDVSFGDVRGTKRVTVADRQVFFKSVAYLLQVPGGWVQILIQATGEDFDETIVESKFSTLRVGPKTPI